MNRILFFTVMFLSLILFASCEKDDNETIEFFSIEGISVENFPILDGSTSTEPLNYMITCKLLGYRYEWQPNLAGNGMWRIEVNREDVSDIFRAEVIIFTLPSIRLMIALCV